jgi:small-conductance mechanosensitive channel
MSDPQQQPDPSTTAQAHIPSESVGSIAPDIRTGRTEKKARRSAAQPLTQSQVKEFKKMQKAVERLEKKLEKAVAQNAALKEENKTLRTANSRILRIPKATA